MSYQVNFRVKIAVDSMQSSEKIAALTPDFQQELERLVFKHLFGGFELKVSPAEVVFL